MRVFVACLLPAMSVCAAPHQHGFYPGRSVTSALLSVLPVLDLARNPDLPVVFAAVDVEKAYDRVDRCAMDSIFSYMGVTDNAFYALYQACHNGSEVLLTGGGGLQ